LISLIKKIDAASEKNKIKSFVVMLNDDEKLADQLKDVAKKNDLKQIVFAVDNPAGPKGYQISKDAEVTVLLYNNRKIEVNEAFRKSDFNAKAVEKVVGQLDKITK